MKHVKLLYIDGRCNNNSHKFYRKMIFVVVDEFGNKLSERTEESGSNNIAELLALREALIWANENGHDQINVKTDFVDNLS